MSLTKFLQSTALFGAVNEDILVVLAGEFTQAILPANETLIQEGDPGDSLYMLETGKLDVFLQDQAGDEVLVSSLLPGDSVGEIALLTGAIRSATVRTAEPSQLWQLTRQAFEQVSEENPALRAAIESAMTARLQRAQLRSAIYENRLFDGLDRSVLPDIEQALGLVSLPSGDILFRAGEASDALYVVINGCLRIELATEQNSSQVSGQVPEQVAREMGNPPLEIGSGQIVGELGILSGEPRTATIVAVRDTLLGRLEVGAFYRLLQKHPKDLLQLTSSKIAADYSNQLVKSKSNQNSLRTIALFALNGDVLNSEEVNSHVPLAAFAQRLTHMFSQYGSALHIDEALTNRMLGQSEITHAPLASAADSRLALWFGEQEANHDYLVYSSQAALTALSAMGTPENSGTQNPWNERCAQQADHILYVAWADSEPHAVSVAPDSKTQRSLVLLHPPDRHLPTGTQRWLDAIQPDWHHHVRWHKNGSASDGHLADGDMARLARLLTGRGVGLVLSGGGARGYAHDGAIRALEEAGIPIDLVGGTSMGAVVAGLSAIGHTAESMTAALVEKLSHRKHIADLTLPIASLLTGQKLESAMRAFYGNTDILDTWRSFFCISTDITRAAEVVHRRGPLWQYVRGSMSLPVVFPPQVDGDNLLIDGCFMNNFPANIMHDTYGCGTVIGVNVCREGDLRDKNQYGNSLSGWAILNGKFNPFAKPLNAPGISETLNRLTDLSTADRSEEQLRVTDLYIRPPVDAFEAQDFEQYQTIIDAGYRAAQPAIAEWLASSNGAEDS